MTQNIQRRIVAAGFTLIEVMIALLIGVIGIVVMMQTFAVSEGFKRTTTAGGDSQINGAVALYLLEREIRNAGYNMNAMLAAGCTSALTYNSSTNATTDMRLVPFEINPAGIPAGDANTDVILVAFGNADASVTGIPAQLYNASPNTFRIYSNIDGFRSGDMVVALQPGAPAPSNCALYEVTQAAYATASCSTPGPAEQLVTSAGSYKSFAKGCAVTAATHNLPAGGAALDKSSGGTLYNVGPAPQAKFYAVRGGNLTMCDGFVSNCTLAANFQVVVNDIVSLRAVYGRDLTVPTADYAVDSWTRAALTVTPTLNMPLRTLAVAVQVTARSGVKEKPRSGTTCDATAAAARPDPAQDWFGPTLTPNDGTLAGAQIDLSTSSADWKCYRYKLFQTTVPIRNMIWQP